MKLSLNAEEINELNDLANRMIRNLSHLDKAKALIAVAICYAKVGKAVECTEDSAIGIIKKAWSYTSDKTRRGATIIRPEEFFKP
jgi:hypothetical protein